MHSLYRLEGDWCSSPVVAIALHSGHELSPEVAKLMALSEQQRFLEEDPFTDRLASVAPARVVVNHSRFGLDLNRCLESTVYREPDDAWGLQVWRTQVSTEFVQARQRQHQEFYQDLGQILSAIQDRFGKRFVVLSMHSYSQSRAEVGKNPDIDVCSWLAQPRWRGLIDSFVSVLRSKEFLGRQLNVMENTCFKAYNLELWLAEHFPESCCLSIEFAKELFMDEPYLRVIPERFEAIRTILDQATQGIQAI